VITTDHRPLAATCTFALRMADGRFVTDPGIPGGSHSIENAHLWLWPLGESDEARAARIAAIVKRHPWICRATAVRARAS